jgi:hypothetical protein
VAYGDVGRAVGPSTPVIAAAMDGVVSPSFAIEMGAAVDFYYV